MDIPVHCRAGSAFYEPPGATADRIVVPPPAGWLSTSTNAWVGLWPERLPRRTHGWKIHLSFPLEQLLDGVRAAADVCFRTGTAFKYVPSVGALIARNAKNADRAASGKSMTIYPASDESLTSLVQALEAELPLGSGPYVLSDVRHQGTSIFFRHGAFLPLVMTEHGEEVLCVPDATGVLAPDRREPAFLEPEGVAVPEVVQRAIEEYRRAPVENPLRRYRAITPMHFSNAGGVYSAVAPDGSRCVIKEARRGAGLDANGDDAVQRLRVEWANVVALQGDALAPTPIERFSVLEHDFIVVEFIEGRTLADRTAAVCPALRAAAEPEEHAAYGLETLALLRRLASVVERLHDQRIVVGDLHPGNVMVEPDGRVRLVDLEDGRSPEDLGLSPFNGLGYRAPDGSTAWESDWYAFARTAMSAFEPDFARELLAPDWWVRSLARVRSRYGPGVADLIDLADRRSDRFGRSRRFAATPDVGLGPVSVTSARTALVRGIARARRADPVRPYPSDPRGLDGPGRFACAHGLAGVLLALQRSGAIVPAPDLDVLAGASASLVRPGLFDGLSGIATVFDECGRAEQAASLRTRVRHDALAVDELGLERGLVGIALAQARSDPDFALDAARMVVRRLRESHGSARDGVRRRPGLFRGSSGIAFALARLAPFDPSGELAGAALEAFDDELTLVRGSTAGTVGLIAPDGERVFPYLANGSSGLLVALGELRAAGLVDVRDSRSSDHLPRLVTSCSGSGYVFDGLFHGFAGVLVGLRSIAPYFDPAVDALARGEAALLDRALTWAGTTQFAGDGLLRLSTDLATGSAGILASVPSTSHAFDWLPVPRAPVRTTTERR